MDRDFYMTAEEAAQFGLIDKVIQPTSTPESSVGGNSGK